MLHNYNCVLTGSAAVEMVVPGSHYPSILDFVCPRFSILNPILFFRARGYAYSPPDRQPTLQSPHSGIHQIIAMHHEERQHIIHIIESSTSSPFAPSLFSPSTIAMNYVTGDGVVSLYPRHMLAHCGKLTS